LTPSDVLLRPQVRPDEPRGGVVELRLLNGFELLCDREPIPFPHSVQRLIAFLAFQQRPVQRLYVAGKLWLDASEKRAFASLRSALWRAGRVAVPIIRATDSRLSLDPSVLVDLVEATAQARRVIDGTAADDVGVVSVALTGEILPDWYDDWLLMEREVHRQLMLHALEAVALRLADRARYAEAVDAALTAIASEPLRESAHRTLVAVYLAEGNASEALRHVSLYRGLLNTELGLEPSPQLAALVAGLTPQ
jgi:DNA-binding SARP family transcriptional activator